MAGGFKLNCLVYGMLSFQLESLILEVMLVLPSENMRQQDEVFNAFV